MAQDKSHKFLRPEIGSKNDLLRNNLSAPDIKNPNNPKFPVDKIAPSNRQPQKSSPGKKPINRGQITRRDDDKVKDMSIGLQDHDEAILYYFNKIIKPSISINGSRINVPLIYGNPERWKGVQRDGHYRDKEGKIQVPLIMYKRDTVEKRRDLGNKMDANNPQLYYVFQSKYTRKNQYDNFSVLQNRVPQKEYHAVVVPDYVKLKYSFVIWTDYIAQMNKIIEAVNYASDSYWGDEERFKFNAKIDSFTNKVEVSQGDNRMVKTDFGLELQGYIIPDALNTKLAKKPQKFFSKSEVKFETEYVTSFDEPKTREEVRKETGEYKVGRSGEGVSYDNSNDDNTIG
tara:strand:+ start:678 stop:1706 length:1029 start_codon:yes stop_codon:yes gene_type:complete